MNKEMRPNKPPNSIEEEMQIVNQLALSDPVNASDRLVQFAQQYAIDSNLVTQSLLVQNAINTAVQEDINGSIQERFSGDIIKLSQQIELDFRLNPEKEKIKGSNKNLIEKYNNLKPEINTVAKLEDISFSFLKRGKINFELSNISLDLKFGEITGVVGENGNGKTTLLKIIAGQLKHKSGRLTYPALFDKTQFSFLKLKQQTAYIPQRLPEWYGSVKENLHFMASIKGIKGRENIREVRYIISRLGLDDYQDSKWDELSSGYQMRFELANMLVWKPKLLVLDEPLANLDIKSQVVFLKNLRDLTSRISYPFSVIITSQHLFMLENVADNIILLNNGKPDYNGPTAQIGENRNENIFEIETSVSINELQTLLHGLHIKKVDYDGFSFFVRAGRHVTSLDICDKFNNAGVQIRLLRDLSRSVKSLFVIGQD